MTNRKACLFKNSLLHEQGMALVLVLVLTGLILLAGSALLTYAFTENLIARYQADDIKQYYLAEAGLERALTLLARESSYRTNFTGTMDEGTFTVSFEELPAGRLAIYSTGQLEESNLTLTVLIDFDDFGNIINIEWLKY